MRQHIVCEQQENQNNKDVLNTLAAITVQSQANWDPYIRLCVRVHTVYVYESI